MDWRDLVLITDITAAQLAASNAPRFCRLVGQVALPVAWGQGSFDSLPAIADFLDGLLHGRLRAASLPRLVARLIVLPAGHTCAVLLASPAALFLWLCHCHPALLLCSSATPGGCIKFLLGTNLLAVVHLRVMSPTVVGAR